LKVNRRDSFKLFALAGTAACALAPPPAAARTSQSVVLDNGLRAHLIPRQCGYISLALILRSEEIVHRHGLAHIMEHTSFSGAAGSLAARDVADAQRDCLQDCNASTGLGVLRWDASFLPRHLPQVLSLLGDITLDQKFDTETVAREANIVLQELYLEKYKADVRQQRMFEVALYGETHPHVERTLDAEIATAKLPAATLAVRLRDYAASLRLPANMDLFMVGQFEPDEVGRLIDQHFGKCAHARGPHLDLPTVGVTRSYRPLVGTAHELKRPLSELVIGWNTGVTATDPDAKTLVALCEYLKDVLFKQLREQHGDTYTPEVAYQPDACSGIINITLPSSKHPAAVEQRALQSMQSLKADLNAREAARLRDRSELQRRKIACRPEAQVDCMVRKAIDGASVDEMEPETVSRDELLAAARKYLPSHKGAYVRLALRGR
jgi:predicted Zn-dependent peptidase